MHHTKLTLEDRERISRHVAKGRGVRAIARLLKRSPSTISRELGRVSRTKDYRAVSAQISAERRAKSRRFNKRKLGLNAKLLRIVKTKLALYWSPRQIAHHLKGKYKSPKMHVSSETIYSYLYVYLRREIRREFTGQLRQARRKRRVRGRSAKGQKSNLADMLSIDERPRHVEKRVIPGHWEGDLMIGGATAQSALGTLVERKTRFVILVPLKSKTAEEVRREFAREMKKLPTELRRSLTYDQGREMAQHKLFTKETQMKVYFAHPRSPWERGTNENTNGLLRQYFPKGTNFKTLTRQ